MEKLKKIVAGIAAGSLIAASPAMAQSYVTENPAVICESERALDRFGALAAERDYDGMKRMLRAKTCVAVDRNLPIRIVDRGWVVSEVEVAGIRGSFWIMSDRIAER